MPTPDNPAAAPPPAAPLPSATAGTVRPSPAEGRPRSLATPLERLPGVGTLRAEKLRKLGLVTAADALMHFPRDYRDFSGAHAVKTLVAGEHASLVGEVVEATSRTTGSGRQMLVIRLACPDGVIRAVWFNMPFMAKRFSVGQRVVIAGAPKRASGQWEFPHPEVRWLQAGERADASEWLAVYPLAEGVLQSHVRVAVLAALDHAADLPPEALPADLLASKGLLSIGTALREDGVEIDDDAQNYYGGSPGTYYGTEIDLQLNWTLNGFFGWTIEAAAVIPGDALQDQHGDALPSFLFENRFVFAF